MQTVLNADKTEQSSHDYKSPWKWKFLDRKTGICRFGIILKIVKSQISPITISEKKAAQAWRLDRSAKVGQCNETTAKYFRSGHKHCIPKEFQKICKFPLRKQNDQILICRRSGNRVLKNSPIVSHWTARNMASADGDPHDVSADNFENQGTLLFSPLSKWSKTGGAKEYKNRPKNL